ncbi:CASP-like protein [Quillaja saponaria]|uniref:CASP-like protein n=1 Tax=Quillaja saponaria TaxID=32244 RepID=A0AAD7PH90_QUISA|nr:CASP-like protein [Quillaja saponaria]
MENQNKGSIGGVEGGKEVTMVGKLKSKGACDLLLRLLALVLTLSATIVLGVDKQTKIVQLKIAPSLPPLDVPATAKWHYLSACVFFVVSNAIACAYAALSVLLSVANRGGKKGLGMLFVILDTLMVALLFSSIGATGSIGVMGYQGNSHVQWNKVCNVFGKFCNQVAASLVLSFLGSIAFMLLVMVATLRLHQK